MKKLLAVVLVLVGFVSVAPSAEAEAQEIGPDSTVTAASSWDCRPKCADED